MRHCHPRPRRWLRSPASAAVAAALAVLAAVAPRATAEEPAAAPTAPTPPATQAPAQLPTPDAKAQKEALALVRDLFKAEYAAKAADKRSALAKTLLKQGLDSAADPAAMFVLLREAADVAAGAGDAETALRAVDELSGRFRVEPDAERAAALEKLLASAKSPEAHRAVAEAALSLAGSAVSADAFDRAAGAVALAEKAAARARDVALTSAVRRRRDEVAAAKARFAKIAKWADLLAKSPEDPDANLEVGRYRCLVRGDWAGGLPLLAKGSDATLRDLAVRSVSATEDPKALADTAAGWWDVAEKLPSLAGPERDAAREYAAERYRAALPKLTGLAKTLAERRIAEADKAAARNPAGAGATAPAGARRTVDLIALIDPAKDALHGEWKVEKGTLRCESAGLVPKVQVPYQPPEEYDLTVTFTQPKLRNAVSVILPNRHGDSFFWAVGDEAGVEYGFSVQPRVPAAKLPEDARLKAGATHTTVVKVRRDGVVALLDGKPLAQFKGDLKDLQTDGWRALRDKSLIGIACDDPTVFQSVRLTEISGPGKKTR